MGTWTLITVLMTLCFLSRYAEMEAIQKNAISHRGRALRKLCAYLEAQGLA